MAAMRSPFRFLDTWREDLPAFVVEVPAGIKNKKELIGELAGRLGFPEYSAMNWDALEESIRDLSWLPPGDIVLKHEDLPLAEDVASSRIYLSILADAVARLSLAKGSRLVVVFPVNEQDRISWLSRLAGKQT